MNKMTSALTGLALMLTLTVGAVAQARSCCTGSSCCNGQACCKSHKK